MLFDLLILGLVVSIDRLVYDIYVLESTIDGKIGYLRFAQMYL